MDSTSQRKHFPHPACLRGMRGYYHHWGQLWASWTTAQLSSPEVREVGFHSPQRVKNTHSRRKDHLSVVSCCSFSSLSHTNHWPSLNSSSPLPLDLHSQGGENEVEITQTNKPAVRNESRMGGREGKEGRRGMVSFHLVSPCLFLSASSGLSCQSKAEKVKRTRQVSGLRAIGPRPPLSKGTLHCQDPYHTPWQAASSVISDNSVIQSKSSSDDSSVTARISIFTETPLPSHFPSLDFHWPCFVLIFNIYYLKTFTVSEL